MYPPQSVDPGTNWEHEPRGIEIGLLLGTCKGQEVPVFCPAEAKCHNQAHSLYWTTPVFCEIVQLNTFCRELHFVVDLVE